MKQNNEIQTVVQLNFRYLCLNQSMQNLNVKIDFVIHGIDISTHNAVVMDNFNNLSVVINTHVKTEIVVSIGKIYPK